MSWTWTSCRLPGKWTIVNDLENRARFLRVDIADPKSPSLEVTVDFTVVRKPVYLVVDPSRVTPLSPALKNAFAEHLDRNAPHMKVTPKIQKMADEVCKSETNAATQAALLIDHVMKVADHYSYTKDPLMPKCGIGDAENCLSKGAAAAPICTRCLFRSLAPAAFPPGWPWAIAFRKRTSVRWSTPVIAAGSSIF